MEVKEKEIFEALLNKNPECRACGKEIRSQKILKMGRNEYHMTCGMNMLYKKG